MTPAFSFAIHRTRVELVKQTERSECAIAALTMLANYYGMKTDLASVRRRLEASSRGSTLKDVLDSAHRLGFTARAVRMKLGGLKKIDLPAILHWDMAHFVVCEKITARGAFIHDPANASRWLDFETISQHFTGIAIELQPSVAFQVASDKSRLRIRQLWSGMSGAKRAAFQIAFLTVVLQLYLIVSPFYMQLVLDRVLPTSDTSMMVLLACTFSIFAFLNFAAGLLRSYALLHAGANLGFSITTNLANRLFRLPISWFEKRDIGDVLAKYQSAGPIRDFLVEGALATVLDGALAIMTLMVMLIYSPGLTAISVATIIIYCIIRAAVFKSQRSLEYDSVILAAREQSTMIESLRGIVTVRLFNKELERHAHWQKRLHDTLNCGTANGVISAWQQSLSGLLFAIENITTLGVAIYLVLFADFTVGMIFAFITYKSQFLQRSASLVDQVIGFNMLGLHLDRASDIALSNEDGGFIVERRPSDAPIKSIEFRGVGFRYSNSDPWVLRNVNLSVGSGEHVVITGPSGCGKSTLLKLMLGLIEPGEGQVLVNGMDVKQYGSRALRARTGAVLQDDVLFSGSISENISFFEDEPNADLVREVCRASHIEADIEAMPMKLNTLIGDMGSSLSGGQKQRVLLARALYKKPDVLVMDEGTSHLDPGLEKKVNESIRAIGCIRVVVAHRSETISAADREMKLSAAPLADEPA